MALQITRFDFTSLQDFQEPLPKPEIVVENPVEPEEELPPPPPTFSEEELAAAKKTAYEEGIAAGIAEEKARQETEAKQREEATLAALNQLVQQGEGVSQMHQQFMHSQTEELGALTLILAQKVAGDIVSQIPEAAILQMVQDCLNVLHQQPSITLSVHPSIAPAMEQQMQTLIKERHLECQIHVKAKDTLGAADGQLEWNQGMAQRDMEQIWSQIRSAIQEIDFAQLAQQPNTTPPIQDEAAMPPSEPTTNDNKGEQA